MVGMKTGNIESRSGWDKFWNQEWEYLKYLRMLSGNEIDANVTLGIRNGINWSRCDWNEQQLKVKLGKN